MAFRMSPSKDLENILQEYLPVWEFLEVFQSILFGGIL